MSTNPLVKLALPLQKILLLLSQSLSLEAALFDRNCHMITCTPGYLENKGSRVHAPFLEDALIHGNILVNKPGHMASCQGCRFKDDCPATLELLHTIRQDDHPLGVIALTAFTDEGQERINQSLDLHLDILRNTADCITALLGHKDFPLPQSHTVHALQTLLNAASDCIFLVDHQGTVLYRNETAHQFFPHCFNYNVKQLVPEKILQGIWDKEGGEKKKPSPSSPLSCLPIQNNQQHIGTMICLPADSMLPVPSLPADISRQSLAEIKGQSPAIQHLKSQVQKLHASPSAVLITGETGSGKEMLARAIHNGSPRAAGPFLPVNCAGIPDNLLESELFGYEEGAFTGARRGGKPGFFELAHHGTLFLDEIGDMPLPMQSKLLRVLQDQLVMRVGASRPIPVDIRIIAATNQDLSEQVRQKNFRADLYYRLHVIPLHLPPLRERKEDIQILARHFLTSFNRSFNRNLRGLTPSVLALLESYDWPGNIRELENVIEYAINMETGQEITLASLPLYLCHNSHPLSGSEVRTAVRQTEEDLIVSALQKHGWDLQGKKLAARELGIGLRTLYRRLQSITPPS